MRHLKVKSNLYELREIQKKRLSELEGKLILREKRAHELRGKYTEEQRGKLSINDEKIKKMLENKHRMIEDRELRALNPKLERLRVSRSCASSTQRNKGVGSSNELLVPTDASSIEKQLAKIQNKFSRSNEIHVNSLRKRSAASVKNNQKVQQFLTSKAKGDEEAKLYFKVKKLQDDLLSSTIRRNERIASSIRKISAQNSKAKGKTRKSADTARGLENAIRETDEKLKKATEDMIDLRRHKALIAAERYSLKKREQETNLQKLAQFHQESKEKMLDKLYSNHKANKMQRKQIERRTSLH